MNTKIKRMIKYAVLAYVISFVFGSLVAVLTGFDASSGEMPTSLWVWSILLTLLVVGIVTHYYFKKEKPSAICGFYFGLALIIIGSIFDMITLVLFARAAGTTVSETLNYYMNPLFLGTIVLLLLTTTVMGWYHENKKPTKNKQKKSKSKK